MRLTQIKLAGFKSFADTAIIRVPGQRVGVVGPNGCGKSNVIDAVRWVLGEASAKQLRGESMQDVIFNGAATRPSAARASVELVFDNSDFTLSGAWGQFAEVAIKRTLNRNGESAYFINNQQVRRRDITDLFLGTGVGVRGYAVIEQGMISRIIEAKPEELRGFVEEAAGVSKYKERRRETETRLKETAANLARLADLQSELEHQAEKLRRQAQTATRYQDIKAELTQAQNRLDYLLWQTALDEADHHMQAHNEVQAAADALAKEQTVLNEEIYRLQLSEHDIRTRETLLTQERACVREEAARLEEQIRHHLNLRQRREREQALAQTEINQITLRVTALEEQIQILEKEAEEKQLTAEETRLRSETATDALPVLTEAAANAAKEYDAHKGRIAQLNQTLALYQQTRTRNTNEKQQWEARLPMHTDETALPDLNTDEIAVNHLQLRFNAMQTHIAEQETHLNNFQAALTRVREHEHNLDKRFIALDAEHAALAAIMPDVDTAAGDFWQHFPQIDTVALYQHIDADLTWQHALSATLGERLFARFAPDFVPQTVQAGRAAWINHDFEADNTTPSPNALRNHIRATAPFQAALNHWLDGILCAENITSALAQQHTLNSTQYFITPEGHRIDRAGVTLYGEYDHTPLLTRQARLNTLNAERETLLPEYTAAQQNVAELNERVEKLHETLADEHRLAQSLAVQLKNAEDKLFRTRAAIEMQQARRIEKAQEQERILADIARLDEENILLDSQIEETSITLFDSEDSAMVAEEHLTRTRLMLDNARQKVLDEERRAHQAQLAARESTQQLAAVRQEALNLTARREALRHRQDELSLNDGSNSDDETTRNNRLNTLSARNEVLSTQLDEIGLHLKQHKNTLGNAHKSARDIAEKLPFTQQKQQAAALSTQQAQLNAEHHRNNLQERGADIAALTEDAAHGMSTTVLNQTITDAARRLNNLGAVNLAALEELAETEERCNYLRRQREDLENAMAMLEDAITQIDNESKALFKQTFDTVNTHMQHYFPTLFGGGEAALTLTEGNLLNAGVNIIARPPGKKNSTIHLLSGGEKALTAMSLVFSLFSLNPAPFCLLDEVDAPLDDANTARFCKLVTEMSECTQFLYISHSRLSMEMAEQLIGITMQEKGVSRIVSVDVSAALKMTE